MSRIKVSDLEITERGFPLLIYAEPRDVGYFSTKEPKLPLLHISTRLGTKPKVSKYSDDQHFYVTHCNRPFRYANTYSDGVLDTDNYRLCPRCAKKQTHKAALVEYHQWISERNAREQAKCEQEQQEAQKGREALRGRLADFGCEFDLPEGQTKLLVHTMQVEFRGRAYEIREIEE